MFAKYSGCGFSNAYSFILSLHRNHAVTFLCYGSYHDKTGVYIHFFKGISYHFSMKQKFLEWFYIIVDVPFQVIFVLIALSGLLLTCVRFFAIHSLWLLIPIWALVIYTSVMTIYWIWLFISSKRLQEDLEVFEIMQKNSLGLCLSMELNLLMSIYYLLRMLRKRRCVFLLPALLVGLLLCAAFVMNRIDLFVCAVLLTLGWGAIFLTGFIKTPTRKSFFEQMSKEQTLMKVNDPENLLILYLVFKCAIVVVGHWFEGFMNLARFLETFRY